MKNKKPIIALGALVAVGLIAGTIAYFTSEATFDNVFTTAVYKTQSTETFTSPENWTPGQEIPKTVITENQGSIPVAVRVIAEESWVNESGNEIDPSVIEQIMNRIDGEDIAIINLDNTSDWVKSDWGNDKAGEVTAYYYKKSLAPVKDVNGTKVYDKTNSFIRSVTLNSKLPTSSYCTTSEDPINHTITKTCTSAIENLGKATYTLKLTVETVQFDQYKNVWFTKNPTHAVEITATN
ncbi:MAG: BsaA family SipW-dependent biofilm matrix protein [Candidatus Saccharibacteria bacterium]|nr:BsaA family SipW-dependent biofilm matrix protein [Candidatus Saccharibacteria bacterium]